MLINRRFARQAVGGAAFAVVIALSTLSAAQNVAARKDIVVRLVATPKTGPTARPFVTGGKPLGVGESCVERIYGGYVPGQGFTVGGGDGLPPDWMSRFTHAWRIEVRRIPSADDAVRLEVTSSRTELSNGIAQSTTSDRRTIALKEGERHVLDFLAIAAPESTIANAVLEIEVPRNEMPGYGNDTLAYDLWLVHETAAAGKLTRQLTTAGSQGQAVPFNFTPLKFGIDAASPGDGSDGPVRVALKGTLTGRVKADGTIEITLASVRTIDCTSGMSAHESGTKTFDSASEETTAVDYPWAFGYCPLSRGVVKPAHARAGVVEKGGGLQVNFKEFFAGEKTSILVTARRQG